MKHTKGPWKYVGKPSDMHLVETGDSQWNIALVQTKEDAHLIAAAPEMLEALELAEKYIRAAVSDGALQDCALPVSNIQRMITGIISKAKGA